MIRSNKQCADCGDKLDITAKTYRRYRYCTECYDSLLNTCDICGVVGIDVGTIVNIEDNGNKLATLCNKCCSTLTKCGFSGCGTVFKMDDAKKCDQCDKYFCRSHRIDHTCKSNEPRDIFRDAVIKFDGGDVNKAKEIKIPWMVGIELEAVNGDPYAVASKLDRRIGISHDGSIQGSAPIELQLPPCSDEKLESIVKHTARIMHNAGYKVNRSCGMHIHVDARHISDNGPELFKILSIYYAIEPVIYAMLPPSRRTNRYALPLRDWIGETKMLELSRKTPPSIDELSTLWYKARDVNQTQSYKHNKYDSSRYHGFNIHSLFNIGTVELRYHHGTLNRRKILNWINLHLHIFEWASKSFDKNVVDAIFFSENVRDKFRLMCRHFKLSKVLRRYVLRNMKKFSEDVEDKD